uniref:Uncharacterized protein n=1 Tax=Fagus sylvatica TaxID=28930 RepID=A0A2N9GER5_FAGSY
MAEESSSSESSAAAAAAAASSSESAPPPLAEMLSRLLLEVKAPLLVSTEEGRRERGSVVVRRELSLVDGGGGGGMRRRWGLRASGTGPEIAMLKNAHSLALGVSVEDMWLEEICNLIFQFRHLTVSLASSSSNSAALALVQYGASHQLQHVWLE